MVDKKLFDPLDERQLLDFRKADSAFNKLLQRHQMRNLSWFMIRPHSTRKKICIIGMVQISQADGRSGSLLD